MTLIGVLTYAGLALIGYPLALPLALVAGGLAFVPNIGPVLTYVPIALAGLGEGAGTALSGMAVYAVAQTFESYVITPLIQKRMVSLPPALILVAQVVGGLLFGLWGVALATPITAVLRLWVERYYVGRGLEGEAPERDATREAA
jgi:predicted PurR-regulated permease PerM